MRVAHFCPVCGAPTQLRVRHGRQRPVCTACDTTIFFEPKVAVVVLVVHENRVLLIERGNDPAKGKWALPAGFVEPEEDPRAAAQRETAEETGLEVEITSLLDVLHRPDADGLADIVIAYAGHLIRGELTPGDDAVAAGWFPADDLPPLGFRTTEIVLGHWHKRAPQDAKPPDP